MTRPLQYLWLAFLLLACDKQAVPTRKNPAYPPGIEHKIERIITRLQAETAVTDVYENKSLDERMRYFHTPGVSIAVINDGRIEWARGFGVADDRTRDSVGTETIFQAGSVSKPIFAL